MHLLQVNTNGVLSFRKAFNDFSPESFPLPSQTDVLVALYWHDHDITVHGNVFYRSTQDMACLTEVGSRISNVFKVDFSPTQLFIATWDEVTGFSVSQNLVIPYNVITLAKVAK